MKASAYNTGIGIDYSAQEKINARDGFRAENAKQELAAGLVAQEWSKLPRSRELLEQMEDYRRGCIDRISEIGAGVDYNEKVLFILAKEIAILDKIILSFTTGVNINTNE